jgi:hypothetical protein
VTAPLPDQGPQAVDAAWQRLEDQLAWYDHKSTTAQLAYKRVKVAQLVVGAAVPVVVLVPGVDPLLPAALGAIVVVLEGLQQLYQWQQNWVQYRATAESLKHEKYLFLAEAGPYESAERARALAERVEGLVSQEHARWTQARSEESR